MDTKLSILFYGKKAKITTDNLLPIYLRVTVSGKRFHVMLRLCRRGASEIG